MKRSRAVLLTAALVVMAAATRFYRLGVKSFWVDEIATKTASENGVRGAVEFSSRDVHPPLHVLVAVAANRVADSELAVRFPAALAGAVSVPLLFWTGLCSGRSTIGVLFAALVFLFSPFHVRLSQDARMYSYSIFFTVVSMLGLWRVVVSDGISRRRRSWVLWGALYLASTVLNIYTSYFSFLLVASQFLFLLILSGSRLLRIDREHGVRLLRFLVVGCVVVVIAYLPWLAVTATLVSHQVAEEVRPAAHVYQIIRAVVSDLGGGNPVWWVVYLGLAALGGWSSRRSVRGLHSLLLFLVPILALFGFRTRHFVSSRYFSFLAPEYYLLVGAGAATVVEAFLRIPVLRSRDASRMRAVRILVSGLAAALLVSGLFLPLRRYYASEIQNWRGAARILARDGRNNDLVFGGVNMSGHSIRYYLSRMGAAERFRYVDDCRDRGCFVGVFSGHRRGWLVTSHRSYLQESYPDLWKAIEDYMVLHARLPALEEWGEILIFRLRGQEESSAPGPP